MGTEIKTLSIKLVSKACKVDDIMRDIKKQFHKELKKIKVDTREVEEIEIDVFCEFEMSNQSEPDIDIHYKQWS